MSSVGVVALAAIVSVACGAAGRGTESKPPPSELPGGPASSEESLAGIADIDDPEAEVLLWDRCGSPPRASVGDVSRFLASRRDDTFSAAAGCLERLGGEEAAALLKPHIGEASRFRRYRAAAALKRLGDDTASGVLQRLILDADAPVDERIDMLRRVLWEDMPEFAAAYVILLGDGDRRIRYHAFNELKLAAGEDFAYDYRAPSLESVALWRGWSEKCRNECESGSEQRRPEGGIGARVGFVSGVLQVVEVLPGTPAAEHGIASGDIIMRIDGDPVVGKELQDLIRYELRGAPGSNVGVSLRRADGSVVEVELTREVVAER